MNFEHYTPMGKFGSVSDFSALGVPPGASVQPQVAELLRDVAEALGLPKAGVVTPWAGREGDLAWKEITSPDTNVALFQITDAKIAEATDVLFGTPLPFVVVLTKAPASIPELQRVVRDSPYDLFETQAVYRQDDTQPVPDIYYLHWLRVKDVADIPRDAKSMDIVAQDMRGDLMFGQQVPVESSTVREAPAISFEDALQTDVSEPVEDTEPPVQETPSQPPEVSVQKTSWVGPIAVGAGVLAATIAIGRKWK